jgi:hypothetical protein
VQLQIGKTVIEALSTPYRKGRYPVWEFFHGEEIIQLEKELIFESDMRVTVQNKKSKLFGGFANQVIGELTVPVESLRTYCEKP